ncbi:MAG: metallophosphoesterase [Clostridia bacterium]|nr:metallophosphoesterase [Clostridia bacterium]
MRRRVLSCALLLSFLCVPSIARSYTIAWITDTQLYSESYPETFYAITDWIVENQSAYDIRFVFHTGDLVNASRSQKQWEVAGQAMHRLDGQLPYLTASGNHDVGSRYAYDNYHSYVDGARAYPLTGGSFAAGRSRYALFSAEGRDYIFVSVSFGRIGPEQEEIDWINKVLAYFSDRTAVLVTHSYQHTRAHLTTQGNAIYNKIVLPNPNVWLVLSGHCRNYSQRQDEIDDTGDGVPDRTVYGVMANYQDAPRGGGGYIRLLSFKEDRVYFCTYSPVLDDFDYYEKPGADYFSIPYPAASTADAAKLP